MLGITLGALGFAPVTAHGQGLTTASLTGEVRAPNGQADGARVRIVNRSNGYAVESEVRRGRYFVSGLESGGPYSVEIRRIGMIPQRREDIVLRVGEQVEVDFDLEDAPIALDTVRVRTAAHARSVSRAVAGGGNATTIGEAVLAEMPVLDRDVLDFARLVPELGTRFAGISGAGVGFRFNSYLIDGASERLLNGNSMLSGPASGKPISIEAVREYQVLLSPYEPRYGDFAGVLVNAVTRSGTNAMHGSAFVYARNEGMARNTPFLRDAPYDRSQTGFSLGGPIVRNRAHFFVAAEFQRFRQPATGPYVGQSASAPDVLPVSVSDIQRFEAILLGYGLDPGNGERVIRANPNSNVFVRTDFSLPGQSRAVLRHNYADSWSTSFARPTSGTPRFQLSKSAVTTRARRWSTVAQLFTPLGPGWMHELLLGRAHSPGIATEFARSPLIEVRVPAATAASTALLVAGSPLNGQGTGNHQRQSEAASHLTYDNGSHTLTAGARVEWFAFSNISTRGQFGRWVFPSLDALEQRRASRFQIEKDFGSATAVTRGSQLSLYAGDFWRATDRLAVTGGLRAEILTFTGRPAYNPAVDSLFSRRTNEYPGTRLQWSPRFGFVLDLDAQRSSRLRGGAGVFAGRPPLAWLSQALRFDGVGTRSLVCEGPNAPAFVADPLSPPQACNNGDVHRDGVVNLIDPRLRMAEMFRTSLAYERALPWGLEASIEGTYTRTLSDFVFVNPNLSGPQGVDGRGRVLYGSIDAAGAATASLVSDRFSEMIDIRNHGNGHSIAATARLDKRFSERIETSAAYTRSRVRDVQSVITAAPPLTFQFWANSRPLSGLHDQLTTGISAYEIAHRLIVTAGWSSAPRQWRTSILLYYVGESGIPFTFTDSTPGKGDLNADGTNSNDPIYVPRNALDPAEIAFDNSAGNESLQREAFESFLARTPCLEKQRGRIMARNSCTAPWVHTANAALRQQLPMRWSSGHSMSLDVELFNVLNLLNRRWGLVRVPNTVALEHVGQDLTVSPSEPVFRFDQSRAAHSAANAESAYQIQLALRYRF